MRRRHEPQREVVHTVLARRYGEQRACLAPHTRETRAKERLRVLGDEVGDRRDRDPAVLLVAEYGIIATVGEADIVARRRDVPPVQVLRITDDVVRPGRRRVAAVREVLEGRDRRATA
jgi:hypothetical protein